VAVALEPARPAAPCCGPSIGWGRCPCWCCALILTGRDERPAQSPPFMMIVSLSAICRSHAPRSRRWRSASARCTPSSRRRTRPQIPTSFGPELIFMMATIATARVGDRRVERARLGCHLNSLYTGGAVAVNARMVGAFVVAALSCALATGAGRSGWACGGWRASSSSAAASSSPPPAETCCPSPGSRVLQLGRAGRDAARDHRTH